MFSLNKKTEKYAYPCYSWEKDEQSFYFPDSAIDPYVKEAKRIARSVFQTHINARNIGLSPFNRHRLLIPEPQLSWQESCALVVDAFKRFHPDLGKKAHEVINDHNRWKLKSVDAGEAGGCCHSANCETNPQPYAIIVYNYDGTINDSVYIAHELGHLIADDYVQAAGFTHPDEKRHVLEVQGFFTQSILYNYLMTHPDLSLRQAADSHFIGEITSSLYALPKGIGALEAEKSVLSNQNNAKVRQSYSNVLETWLGERWQEYDKAKRLLDHITESDKRDCWGMCDLHQHPMASIVATGLFLRTMEQNQCGRSRLLGELYGKEGPKGILDVYDKINLHTSVDVQKLAQDTICYIAAPLMAKLAANSAYTMNREKTWSLLAYEM